ncbi:ATP-dependent DNA helicase, partial [Frankliniella fusca]
IMGNQKDSDERRKQRERDKFKKRKRRANMTEDQLEKKRAYDRDRYKIRKMQSSVQNDSVASDPTTSQFNDFQSERLRILYFKKKIETDKATYRVETENLIFEKKLDNLNIVECKECDTFYWNNHNTCYCHKHSDMVKELLTIGNIPEELQGLSYVEELLISKIHPMISVYRLRGGQYAYNGNVINFRQDVATFCNQLPHAVCVLNGLLSVCCNTPCFQEDFLIRRNKVSIALHWLKQNNVYYHDIVIDLDAILKLPDHGYFKRKVNSAEDDKMVDSSYDTMDSEDIDRVVVPGVIDLSTDDKISHALKWPKISSDPANEFNTRGYIAQAFPVLFPYGRGDYLDVKKKKVTARVYFQYLMQKCDRRFSKHKLFPYFALNSILRWEALSLGMLYMKKKPELKELNIEHLKGMVSANMRLPKSIMLYSSSLRGSKAYWMSRTYELDAMVDRFNLPTIFFSISAADCHWPRQFEILLTATNIDDCNVSQLTEKQRRTILIDNADLCADYFYESIKIFVVEVLVPFLKAYEYWFRFEWQMRGVGHIHGVLWLTDAPAVIDFENMSETEKGNVINYFSSLISAWNPNCQYVVTASHPCRIKISQVENATEDLAALVNTVQRHKCSAYCLKKMKNVKDKEGETLKCRHNFPHKLQDVSTIEKNDRGHLEFFPMRNDPTVNKFSQLFLPIIRSNHDFTAILTYNGFVRYLFIWPDGYISKYATKGEVTSRDLLKILKEIVFKSDAEESVKTVIQKLFINLAADRDHSFQEVIHILKGHKLYESSRTFIVLNLSESEWQPKCDLSLLSSEDKSSGITEKENIQDTFSFYSARPKKYENMTLLQSMRWFNIKTFKKYQKEHVVRILPRFREQVDSSVSEAIWRQNALLNIPWRDYNSLQVHDSWQLTCQSHQVILDMFPYNVSIAEPDISDDEHDEDNEMGISHDDWMKICEMDGEIMDEHQTTELGKRPIDISYPWSDNICDDYYCDLLLNFVAKSRKNENINKVSISLPTLSPDQKHVMAILNRQIEFCKNSTNSNLKIPRLIICEGFAGSGKSILLQSMVQTIESELGLGSALVLAPTGSSALHVNGQTIHSALRLNWRELANMPDLKGESLFKWREKYQNVKFVFIEEYSMVGCKLMFVVHKRLCQLTENINSIGNLIVWFMGNIRQLPPVADTPWYKEDLTSASAAVVAGSLLYRDITLVCFLISQLRQTNLQYLKCLENVSVGKLSIPDNILLKNRFRTKNEIEEDHDFDSAVHIYSRRKDVDIYNISKLKAENKPVLIIESENSSRYARSCSSDQALGLPKKLLLSIGCRVMLKRNLWIDGGLVNGSLGTVIDIVYQSSSDDSPICIIVKFDYYTGPVLPNGGVPIVKYTNSWYSKNILCSRVMFPLTLAYAVTIYRSQGLTLPKVVLHITGKEMAAGEFYVGLSRVKSPLDIYIVYEGILNDCPLFNLNSDIYQEKILAEEKLMLKGIIHLR